MHIRTYIFKCKKLALLIEINKYKRQNKRAKRCVSVCVLCIAQAKESAFCVCACVPENIHIT